MPQPKTYDPLLDLMAALDEETRCHLDACRYCAERTRNAARAVTTAWTRGLIIYAPKVAT